MTNSFPLPLLLSLSCLSVGVELSSLAYPGP